MAGVEQQAFSLPFRNMRCIHPEVMLCVVIAVGKDGARSSAREMAKSDGLRWADGVPHLAVVCNGFYAALFTPFAGTPHSWASYLSSVREKVSLSAPLPFAIVSDQHKENMKSCEIISFRLLQPH